MVSFSAESVNLPVIDVLLAILAKLVFKKNVLNTKSALTLNPMIILTPRPAKEDSI